MWKYGFYIDTGPETHLLKKDLITTNNFGKSQNRNPMKNGTRSVS